MKRFCMWTAAFVAAMLVIIATFARGTPAAVKSASTDGEATAYLTGTFSKPFDVAYRARLTPGARNKSWTTLSILLVGEKIPGPGASVGLTGDASHARMQHPFTYVVYPGSKDDYRSYGTNCTTGCVIELRGDRTTIYALLNGKELAHWSRSDLYLKGPYMQLNAEVHDAGDSLDASLTPLRTVAAGRALPHPTCAFTTRGIQPAGHATITFHGRNRAGGAAFVNLLTGARAAKC